MNQTTKTSKARKGARSKKKILVDMERLVKESVQAFAQDVAEIWQGGDVAVGFYELQPAVKADLMNWLGWDGKPGVVRMPRTVAHTMSEHCKRLGDLVTGQWLNNRNLYRVFVFAGDGGSFLINHELGEGFYIQPGSRDQDWMS
jgi:hypothetical protein